MKDRVPISPVPRVVLRALVLAHLAAIMVIWLARPGQSTTPHPPAPSLPGPRAPSAPVSNANPALP